MSQSEASRLTHSAACAGSLRSSSILSSTSPGHSARQARSPVAACLPKRAKPPDKESGAPTLSKLIPPGPLFGRVAGGRGDEHRIRCTKPPTRLTGAPIWSLMREGPDSDPKGEEERGRVQPAHPSLRRCPTPSAASH